MKIINKSVPVRRISPADGEYFFGYYDLPAMRGALHLAHKAPFADRLQKKGDRALVGVIDTDSGKFEELDETEAWNFQQGAMLQWNPAESDEIIYNCVADGEYRAAVMNIKTGKKRFLDMPVANVSPKGDYALSVNFSRIYDFRPGYGYASFADRFYYKNHPEDDGIFLTDIKTGKSKMIISLDELWNFAGSHFNGNDQKITINHITFNTDGSRFLCLVRNFVKPGEQLITATVTANADGSDMFLLSDFAIQSHYNWRDRENVIFYASGKELSCSRGWANNYILRDKSHSGEPVADYFFVGDNHMIYSPDRTLLLADTYPDGNRMQALRIYDFAKDMLINIGKFYSLPRSVIDIRCDLHPRWDNEGKRISFDSTHEGIRGIYMTDIDKEKLFKE